LIIESELVLGLDAEAGKDDLGVKDLLQHGDPMAGNTGNQN